MHALAWTVMGLLFIVVVAFRLATRGGRRQIWWVCATIGPATGIASGVLIGNAVAVDAILGTPNVAALLSILASLVGACCVFIFWHAVRHESPSNVVISAHLGVVVLLGLIITGIWAASPVFRQTYGGLRHIPLSDPTSVAASLAFYGYYAASQAVSAICAYWALRRPPDHDSGFREPALRLALAVTIPVAISCVFGELAWAAATLRVFAGRDGASAFAVGDLLTMVTMAGYTLTGTIVLFGPRLHRRTQAQHLLGRLSGLWRRIRDLYPAVVLQPAEPPGRPYLRAQRMLIEIADGLSLLPVPAGPHPEPIEAVARALAHPLEDSGLPATTVLPVAETRQEEEDLFLSIAAAYAALISADAGPGRPSPRPTAPRQQPATAVHDAQPGPR